MSDKTRGKAGQHRDWVIKNSTIKAEEDTTRPCCDTGKGHDITGRQWEAHPPRMESPWSDIGVVPNKPKPGDMLQNSCSVLFRNTRVLKDWWSMFQINGNGRYVTTKHTTELGTSHGIKRRTSRGQMPKGHIDKPHIGSACRNPAAAGEEDNFLLEYAHWSSVGQGDRRSATVTWFRKQS